MSTSHAQVQRMLALVPYLQSNDGLPLTEVAREFGVTPKQMRDDLKLLMYTGIGQLHGDLIDFDLGALEDEGVVHIRDAEFMTRPLRISAQEGAALVVALRTLRASAGTGERGVIDSALAKIETALDGSVQAPPVDVVVDSVETTIHDTVSAALSQERRLRMTYANETRDESTLRDVDPRRMFTERGELYLEAWCHQAEDLRFFRLDRITEAEVLDEPVQDRETPSPDVGGGMFTPGEDTPSALVELHPGAHWMTEYHQVDLLEQAENGVWTARLYGADWGWLRRLVMRNAGSLVVLEPDTLRAQVADSARSALAAYDEEQRSGNREG